MLRLPIHQFPYRPVAYVAFLLFAIALSLAGAKHMFKVLTIAGLKLQLQSVDQRSTAIPTDASRTRGRVVLTQDDWLDRLRSKDFWEGKGSNFSGPRPAVSKSSQARPATPEWARDGDGSYRTVCVRLCDGAYVPISFATAEDNFEADEQRCKASCSSPARLFVQENPEARIEDMKDLTHQPYSRLKTAFFFRTKYDETCKCKPHPWEQQAMERHRLYALEAAKAKGDRVAAREADTLKLKIASELRTEKATKSFTIAQARSNDDIEATSPKTDRKANAATKGVLTTTATADMARDKERPPGMMRAGTADKKPASTRSSSSGRKSLTADRSWQAKAFGGQ